MTLNELMRRLHDSDPQVRYVCTFLYEAFVEQQKQMESMSSALFMMAKLNEAFMKRDEALNDKLTMLEQHGRVPGVEVSSVAPDPEKGEK